VRLPSAALLLLPLLASACAHPPKFVKTTPFLRVIYRPSTTPYLGSKMFSFEIKRTWQGPEEKTDAARYRSKDGRAHITVLFVRQGAPEWKPPEEVRRKMKESGAVEDSHMLYAVEVSSRPAERASYTTYVYDSEYLLGQKYEVRYSDAILVPDPEGFFMVSLECPKQDYRRHLRDFEAVLRSLSLRVPRVIEE
jgi:hypothetical protein